MIKTCPRCSKYSFHRITSSKCEVKQVGNTTTGCGQVDFEVWKCYNELCPNHKKSITKSIPCKCTKRHDNTNK